MAEIRLLKPPAVAERTEKAKDDARRMRDLADDVESGKCNAFVCVAVVGNELQTMTNTTPFETVTLARLMDAWAVKQVLT